MLIIMADSRGLRPMSSPRCPGPCNALVKNQGEWCARCWPEEGFGAGLVASSGFKRYNDEENYRASLVVESIGMDPKPTRPAVTSEMVDRISFCEDLLKDMPPELELLRAAYQLVHGTKAEQASALSRISLLTVAITHSRALESSQQEQEQNNA